VNTQTSIVFVARFKYLWKKIKKLLVLENIIMISYSTTLVSSSLGKKIASLNLGFLIVASPSRWNRAAFTLRNYNNNKGLTNCRFYPKKTEIIFVSPYAWVFLLWASSLVLSSSIKLTMSALEIKSSSLLITNKNHLIVRILFQTKKGKIIKIRSMNFFLFASLS